MPKFMSKRWYGMHGVLAVGAIGVLTIIVTFFHWLFSLLGVAMLIGVGLFSWYAEKQFQKDFKFYIASLSHRVKRAGESMLKETPIGVIVLDEHGVIQWHNPVVAQLAEEEDLVGQPLEAVLSPFAQWLKGERKGTVSHRKGFYAVQVKDKDRILFITDVTELVLLRKRYEEEKTAIGIIHLDNLEEVSQGMEEQEYTLLLAKVFHAISDWAHQHNMFIRRISNDKFLIVLDRKTLQALEETRFEILDVVRDLTRQQKIPITLSIGVGADGGSLIANGNLSRSSLDIALGRGGDQAAVKVGDRLSFYGGKSNAVEKRTRVRVRVISHAMRDLILESDVVLVMGHATPDLDAMGACLGVLQMVQMNGKKGYIVLDEPNPAIERLMQLIQEEEELLPSFVSPEEALHLCQPRSLVVLVDTHRPSMAVEPRLLEQTRRVMVIDHHRRGEEMVEDPLLLCIEPYASSTCELVTELLQYQGEQVKMPTLIATALLAGVVIDTKGFIFQTGSRTFEAASFLRRMGADPTLVQRLLKEDMESFKRRMELMKRVELVSGNIAVVTADDGEQYDPLLIAQTADSLLHLRDIIGSFVVARRTDNAIHISGRSFGEFNVQVILERLGGGGHLTHAAAQLKEGTTTEAARRLKGLLQELSLEKMGGEAK